MNWHYYHQHQFLPRYVEGHASVFNSAQNSWLIVETVGELEAEGLGEGIG